MDFSGKPKTYKELHQSYANDFLDEYECEYDENPKKRLKPSKIKLPGAIRKPVKLPKHKDSKEDLEARGLFI